MTRTREEIMAEILRRVDLTDKRGKQKRERLKIGIFTLTFLFASAALAFTPWNMKSESVSTATARAELLYTDIGGYVLIGVICFAAGAATVMIGMYIHRNKQEGHEDV